jgi:predicted HTH transcriptional regulator
MTSSIPSVSVTCSQTKASTTSNELGMRTMQEHAALKYIGGQKMTNATLRERLGIDDQNAAQASRVIRATLDADLIRPADAERPRAGYVPSWA